MESSWKCSGKAGAFDMKVGNPGDDIPERVQRDVFWFEDPVNTIYGEIYLIDGRTEAMRSVKKARREFEATLSEIPLI